MARKSRRSSSRKMKHTRKHKTHRRRTHRRRGGAEGAPVNYHLSGSWPSRMSLGQGADYFKYHEGQHGGGLGYGKFPEAVMDPGLPAALRGPAHIGGIDKAIADVRGLCDPPNCPGTTPAAPAGATTAGATTGGRRRTRNRRNRTNGGNRNRRNRSRRNRTNGGRNRRNRNRNGNANAAAAVANVAAVNAVNAAAVANVAAANATGRNRNRRRRGGSLGYAPFPSPGMLLSSPQQYAQAGLNPEWKTDVAFTDAKIREMQ
jgi:hypothetical protein